MGSSLTVVEDSESSPIWTEQITCTCFAGMIAYTCRDPGFCS